MSEISVIGLGAIWALHWHGRWYGLRENHGMEQDAGPPSRLSREGATQANTIEEAVDAAPLIRALIGYGTTHDLLARPPASTRMVGRLLIQLSTGTPMKRVRQSAAHSLALTFLLARSWPIPPKSAGRTPTSLCRAQNQRLSG